MATTTIYYPSTSWKAWNLDWYSTSSTTITASNNTWSNWNTSYSSTTSYTITNSWSSWNEEYLTRAMRPYVPETAEQRQVRDERRREQDERRRQEDEVRQLARRTAHQLLVSVLDEEQALQYDLEKQFITTGSDGRRYLLTLGRQHNVFVLDERGNRVEELCGHVGEYVPDEDNLVAQKLRIEMDALGFRQICNIWDLRGGGRRTIHQSGAPLRELAVA